jgi:hypothetical protein
MPARLRVAVRGGVTAGRKTMKSVVTVLVILLLAAAGAAGAGDNIKWKRSKELNFVGPDELYGKTEDGFEKLTEAYTLTWKASRGSKLGFIQARFFGWDLYCANLESLIEKGKLEASALESEVEKSRELFREKLIFYVTAGATEANYARLSNHNIWDIYLEVDGEERPPVKLEPVENPVVGTIRIESSRSDPLNIFTQVFIHRSYVVEFENPYNESRPPHIRLVMSCDECRRGFEWRFKEE